jgi:hypothetical protein
MRHRSFAIAVLAAVAFLRLAMVMLPALGRDEVTYLYWTHQSYIDYAPLLQLQILFARLVSDAPWFLRLSQLGIGVASLFCFAAWLRARDVQARWLAVAALAATPWLTFSGAILHPDGLFVLGLLVFALGLERERPLQVLLGAVICLGAKLSGVIPVAVALVWLARGRRMRPFITLAIIAVGFRLFLQPETLGAARDFARIDGGIGLRLLVLFLEMVLVGGTLVIIPRITAWRTVTVTGVLIVAGFVVMAVFGGQSKANWLLPGLILLWPGKANPRLLVGTTLVALSFSTAMVAGYVRPEAARWAEESLRPLGILPDYRVLAGEREGRVASGRTWEDYLAGFHGQLHWSPPDSTSDVRVVVSDDYALAARFALECPVPVPVIVVPGDPLFDREPAAPLGRQLVVAVRVPLEQLVDTGTIVWRGTVAHPVTGSTIQLALLEDMP